MIERNGVKLYTGREVSRIMRVGYQRIVEAMDARTLIATDIEPWRGRNGFRYLFSEEEINRYAEKVGLPIRWERLEMEKPYDEEYEQKVLEAQREVREEYDPSFNDRAIQITTKNVHEIFEQKKEEKDPAEKFDYYLLKIGNGYVTDERVLVPNFLTDCLLRKERAERLHEIFGGTLFQMCAEAVR